MAMGGGRLPLLVATVVLLLAAVACVAEHEVFASGTEERGDSLHGVSKLAQGKLKPSQCKPKCDYRCSNTQYEKPCLFFCNKCCNTCLCVPSGLYGHKEECPCYNNWKTKEGGPKCP